MNINPEQIKQVIESIKTLNININDATTQKIAEAIIPVVKMYIIQNYISMFLWFIGAVGLLTGVLLLAKYAIKKAYESGGK